MSQTPSPANSHYRYIFDNALEAYKQKTGKDLTSDPLLHRLETCRSPDEILVILREHVSGLDHPHNSNNRLTNCLNSTVNVLYTFSTIIGASPGLVSPVNLGFAGLIYLFQPFPPAAAIFTGIGIVLSASIFDLISFSVLL